MDTLDCVRFDQTKFLARNLGSLAAFYETAFGCETVVPILEVSDDAVARAVGVPDAVVTLTILQLPGRGDDGPVLELYSIDGETPDNWVYKPGQGQIAFEVEDLESSIGRVMSAGGSVLGEVVEWVGPSGSRARFVYLNDPEGNIVDLWSRVT